MKRADIWCVTLGLNFICWVLFPEIRTPLSLILTMHLPVLIWGIFDIRSQFFGPVFINNYDRRKSIALTFDDGPDPTCTPAVLDLLREFNFTATFFLVGVRAQKHPDLVQRALHEGHQIACHDLTHSLTGNFRMEKRMFHDIARSKAILEELINTPITAYRPPVGLMNPHVLPVCRKLKLNCIGWSRSAVDKGNRVLGRIKKIPFLAGPGDIIMMHDTLPKPAFRDEFFDSLRHLFENIRKNNLVTERIDVFITTPEIPG